MSVAVAERRAWTAPGTKDAAERTYASIKYALANSAGLKRFDYEVFLQGSYANVTNLRGDSDVDIVAMLRSTFVGNTKRLSTIEKAVYERARVPATVTINTFRDEVRTALAEAYGAVRVHDRNKCIQVDKRDGYIDADVVPSYQYKLFTSYPQFGEPKFIEGIEIHPKSGGSIINFPKEHIKNGQQKNARCGDRYKPTVRQIKRLSNHAADLGKFEKGTVPGYVLECMVYNINDAPFIADDGDRLLRVMAALHSLDASQYAEHFKSCDGVHHLFKDDPGRHNEYTARRVIETMWEVL